ncbi:MAG: ABC transporter permease [Alphaproteobacteria bacterium]
MGQFILPPPIVVIRTAFQLCTQAFNGDIIITLIRSITGICLSIGCGIIFGLCAGLSRPIAFTLRPMVIILLAIPPIIWVVLALFWLGMGGRSVIFTVFLTCLPFTFTATMQSVLNMDKDILEMATLYKIPVMRKITQIYIPYLCSHIFPAISVTIGMAIKITVMAELLGANDGMGAQIATARAMLDTQSVMAYILIIVAIVMITEYLIVLPIKRLFMPWENVNVS